MQTERQTAANRQTLSIDLARESAGRLLPSTSTIAIYYHYSALKADTGYSFYRPADGGKLIRPGRCSKSVVPAPLGGRPGEESIPRWKNIGRETQTKNMHVSLYCTTATEECGVNVIENKRMRGLLYCETSRIYGLLVSVVQR